MVNVGKYTVRPMEHVGMGSCAISGQGHFFHVSRRSDVFQMSFKVTMMGSYSMKIRAESCKHVDHGAAVFFFLGRAVWERYPPEN